MVAEVMVATAVTQDERSGSGENTHGLAKMTMNSNGIRLIIHIVICHCPFVAKCFLEGLEQFMFANCCMQWTAYRAHVASILDLGDGEPCCAPLRIECNTYARDV